MIFFKIIKENLLIYYQIKQAQKVNKKLKLKQQHLNIKMKIRFIKKRNYLKNPFKIRYIIIKMVKTITLANFLKIK